MINDGGFRAGQTLHLGDFPISIGAILLYYADVSLAAGNVDAPVISIPHHLVGPLWRDKAGDGLTCVGIENQKLAGLAGDYEQATGNLVHRDRCVLLRVLDWDLLDDL